jgi:hypothetical protein
MPGYVVQRIDGIKRTDRREVVFLTRDNDDELNAAQAFAGLDEKRDRLVRDRFDYWTDGGINDNYFHGWPNDPTNKECFSFRWNQKRLHHRFYGFLYRPKPKTNARFLLCILLSHAIKTNWNTDPHELGRANTLRVDPCVIAAIAMMFSDDGHEPCLN